MRSRLKKTAVIFAIFVIPAGCGKNDDYNKRYLKLQERYEKKIGQLQADREKDKKSYEQKISMYESRLNSLREKLSGEEFLLSKREAKDALQTGDVQSGGAERATARLAEETGTVLSAESGSAPALPDNVELLEDFMEDYAPRIEEERREQFRKDFTAYIDRQGEQSSNVTNFKRRDIMLERLKQRLSETADGDEQKELLRRMDNIQNAGSDNLAGVLDYYERLDDFRNLKILMDDYNISRQELRESGVEPPPRDSRRPDAKETAFNLSNFISNYEPLIDSDRREQYKEDFGEYINDLTTRPTDEQVLQIRDQRLAELKERAETASDREKSSIERRMTSLQNSDMAELRRMAQSSKLRELNQLVEKYDIPRDELTQSGVLFSRRRSPIRRQEAIY